MAEIEIDITSAQQEQPDIDVHPIYGLKGAQGERGLTGNGISSITLASSVGLVDTYTVTYTNGNTTTFTVANGNGVQSIEKTSTDGLVDTYTITFDNGNETTYTVTNGAKGDTGEQGIQGVQGERGDTGATPDITMTASVNNTVGTPSVTVTESGTAEEPVFNLAFSNLKGEQGVSVTGVTLQSTVGLDKTYRMTFSDSSYFDFVVSNGAAGATEWGAITGTLSNQTDLYNILNAKADTDLSNITNEGLEVIVNNGGVPPQSVNNAKVYVDDGDFKLMWTDPDDISIPDYSFYEWTKTVVVAKVGSFPESPTDGVTVVTETTKNTYSSTPYVWTPSQYDDYYFRAFPYSQKNVYAKDNDNKFTGLAPSAITNPISHKTTTGYQLKWSDPVDGSLLSWAATYIIRKEGNYPESITDGIQVLKSTTRNAYSSTPYADVVPDITKNYYYRAYTYSTNNLYNDSIDNQFLEVTPDTAVDCFVDNTSHSYPELIWSDPADKTFCTWEKTVIVRKTGSAPTSPTDGDVIYTETIKNNHSDNTNPYVDTTAQSGVTYYYKAFPCSTNGVYNTSSDTFVYKSIYSQIYEFIINTAESEPTAAVTYAGANASYTPASMNFTTGAINYGSWADAFFQPRPVMVKYDGTVDYELSKSDFTKKDDGVTASDVANIYYNGNCMIAFPQVWMKFVQDDSTHQHVYIADSQIDNDYHCYTHQNKNGTWLDEIFIMAFEPSNFSNTLRSIAGRIPLSGVSGKNMRTYAQANGSSWDFMDYGELQMLQMLCVLMFKSLDTQSKIGAGDLSGGDLANKTTGTTKDKGMFYAVNNTATSTTPIKVFGIENLWGSAYKWMNGLVIPKTSGDGTVKYKLCDYTTDGSTATAYTTSGTGYKTLETFSTSGGFFPNKMTLNSDGLFPSVTNQSGSLTTYYCDMTSYEKSSAVDYFALFGLNYYYGFEAGLFSVYVGEQLAGVSTFYGASLSCKPY